MDAANGKHAIATILAGMDDKVNRAKRRVGDVKAIDAQPPEPAKVKVRPLGGLIPEGFKATWTKKF